MEMAPPRIDLSDALVRGTEEWRHLGRRACENLEEYGWLVVNCDKIPEGEKEEMFDATRSLVALPLETKLRHASIFPYYLYVRTQHYESFGVMNADMPEKAMEFTRQMWPDGNDHLCKIMGSMSNKMLDLVLTLLDAICDSYGVDRHQDIRADNTEVLFRLSNYTAPMRDEPDCVLSPHIDADYLTILCNNGVEGLSAKAKDGSWFQVNPGKGSLVLFVGQALKAWSNGRLHAPLHKVTLGGDKDRFMCGLFFVPKENEIIQPHRGFIDKENPAIFKPFVYKEFLQHSFETKSLEGTLESFAGI